MIFANRIKQMTGRQMTSIGISLMMFGVALIALGSHFLNEPTFVAGFVMGFGSVVMGTSIVFNVRGLVKIRAERNGR